ncbi:uncharacterized protein [Aegilops tauschii subsp. strangulata]|nr:uncharacterized protein LOC109734000 [Aegilops tauschii subsp. strangulata]
MEVVDLVSSDSEDEACAHSPDRKRPAWDPADPSRGPGSLPEQTSRMAWPPQQPSRMAWPPQQPSQAVKKDKEKAGEGGSAWAAGPPSLRGGSHASSAGILGARPAGWDSWSAAAHKSRDERSETPECCWGPWGDEICRSVCVPKEDGAAMPGQSCMAIPELLMEDSSAWLSRIKGLHFPLPDESQLKARQIQSDEMLALKLQEQFNQEQPGSQSSQQVDTTLAWTLQEQDAARARIAAREGQSSSRQRDRSMAHLYSYGWRSQVQGYPSWPPSDTSAPITSRRWLPRNSSPGSEQQNMIISQLTKGCFGQENMDLEMRMAVLDSLQEALESCADTYPTDSDDDDYENLIALDDNNHRRGASDSEIDSLPLSVAEGESRRDEPCPICLDCPADGASLRHLPCAHKFHKECIDRWLRMRTSCPVCKSAVF